MVSVCPGLVTPGAQQLFFYYYLLNNTQAHHFVNTRLRKEVYSLLFFVLPRKPFQKHKKGPPSTVSNPTTTCLTALRMDVRRFCIHQMLNLTLLDKGWFHAAVFTLEAQRGFTWNTICCQIYCPSKNCGLFSTSILLWLFLYINLRHIHQQIPFLDTKSIKLWKCSLFIHIYTFFSWLYVMNILNKNMDSA